jgi:nitroimidazol reductase NimA-like FMN-containing flavoprotein (pyridoxamine 5'-phosphate oxidase superfamily)
MPSLGPTPRTRVRRLPKRGVYEREAIDAVLDEGLVCHLGFVHDGHPVVIPTLYARVADVVYVHGSAASRMLRALADGFDACLTVTLLDGLVLARSAFHHSANYRSVVVFGRARHVAERGEKLAALEAFSEHVAPGRWAEVRPPSAQELKATTVLALPLEEASAKVRAGPPVDDEEDYPLDVWAGVIPLRLVASAPETDARVPPGVDVPAYAVHYDPAGRQRRRSDRRPQ